MKVSMSAKAFRLLLAGAFAASATVLPISGGFAAGETRGAKCTTEGESTGTKVDSLVCKKNASGRLVWSPQKLSASNLKPVKPLRAPRGSIEFWHWRGEDRAYFDKIISDFEDLNPGVKITQTISNSADYQATALTKAKSNKKAALFVTFRGSQFNQAAEADFYTDLTNEQFTKRNVIASMMGSGQYNGKQLGIPYQSLFNDPIYNIKIFKDEGWKLPKTFNDWIAYCKEAKSEGYVPMAWMGAFPPQAGQIINSALMNTAPNEAALKKQVSDIDTGKTEITIKWFKDMAQKYADLRDAGCFPANPKSVTEVDGNTLFATGKSPILPTGTFSMGSVRNLNPAMKGNMGVLGMNWTNDVNATYTGITNNPFIMGINKAAGKTEQKIARAFLSYLLQGEVAEYYAKSSAQHVTVLGVQYDDVDLRNTQTIMSERLILAPRFIFLNKAVSDAAEAALIEIVGGEGVDKALEDGAKKIKQILNK